MERIESRTRRSTVSARSPASLRVVCTPHGGRPKRVASMSMSMSLSFRSRSTDRAPTRHRPDPMLQIVNFTPFAAERAVLLDRDGHQVWTVVVKATYRLGPDGTPQLDDEQEPVCRAPEYSDGPGSSLLREPEPVPDPFFMLPLPAPGGLPAPAPAPVPVFRPIPVFP